MIKRILWIGGICIITAILIYIVSRTSEGTQKNSDLRLTIFPSGNGWGYQIEKHKKTFIYQPFIPVIQGKHPFPSQESARKIGEKVMSKIRSNQIPVITEQDLLNEGITLKSAL